MRRLMMTATMVVALTLPATVATVAVSTPAWAAGVTCHKLMGYAFTGHKFMLKKCTPPNAEKTLSGLGTDLTTVGGPTIDTWKWNGGATTIVSLTVAQTVGVCPAGYAGYTDSGTVTAGTSGYTMAGDSVSMVVCKKSANPYRYELRLAGGTMASL